jgi:hypothetical protein
VISGPDDPSVRSAIAIAAAVKENVLALSPQGATGRTIELAEAAGVRVEAGPAIQTSLGLSSLLQQMTHLKERLFVMSRQAVGDKGAFEIVSRRRIPVLLAPRT